MNDTYTLSLKAPEHDLEEFEKEDKNLMELEVQLPSGEILSTEKCRVLMTLSKDAMLGFGTELIRKALKGPREGCWEIHPIDPNGPCETMGIYLHPKSCELILSKVELETVQAVVDRVKAE